MKEFDYVIIGGGCAGLSLAYELEIHEKLKDKTLAIIEPREKYIRDKTWSFWNVAPHNFEDCVKKSWKNFTINIPGNINHINCGDTPYQTIDSGLFYTKIITKLKCLSSIPCNVDKTFQMDTRENKKIDEIKQYNIRLLIFISSPS